MKGQPIMPGIGNSVNGMDISLIDETLDINLTENYHISIQGSLNGYSFSILDKRRNKYILLRYMPFEQQLSPEEFVLRVDELHSWDEYLSRNFGSASFIWLSTRYTIVPESLFDTQNLRTYFSFNQEPDETDSLFYNAVRSAGAVIIFAVPRGLCDRLTGWNGKVRFYSQITPFVERLVTDYGGKDEKYKAMVNVHPGFIDMAVLKGNSLKLCNSYGCKNEKDFIFFLLYVFEQLRLNQEETPVFLSGDIDRNSPHFEMLKKNIRKISFEKYSDHFNYSYKFMEVEPHRFSNLLNLNLCE